MCEYEVAWLPTPIIVVRVCQKNIFITRRKHVAVHKYRNDTSKIALCQS